MTNVTAEAFFNAPNFADLALVKRYIEQGGDVNAVTDGGNNILWHIASSPIPDAHMRAQLIEMAELCVINNVSAAQQMTLVLTLCIPPFQRDFLSYVTIYKH